MSIPKSKLVLEFDDFHWKYPENCLLEIEYLVKRFPNVRLSLFCTPALAGNELYRNTEWCDKVRYYINLGNIRLGVHGLYHSQEEFKFLDRITTQLYLNTAISIFERANLPFTKCFRGPHWGLNENTIKALNGLEFTHLYSHPDYKQLESLFKGKVVYYNWNLKDNSPNPEDTLVIGHGHTHNVCQNGINESMYRLIDVLESNKYQTIFIDDV